MAVVSVASPVVDSHGLTDTTRRQVVRKKQIRGWISKRLKALVDDPNEKGNIKVAAMSLLADMYGLKGGASAPRPPATTNVMLASGSGSVDTLVAKLSDALVSKLPSSSDPPE